MAIKDSATAGRYKSHCAYRWLVRDSRATFQKTDFGWLQFAVIDPEIIKYAAGTVVSLPVDPKPVFCVSTN